MKFLEESLKNPDELKKRIPCINTERNPGWNFVKSPMLNRRKNPKTLFQLDHGRNACWNPGKNSSKYLKTRRILLWFICKESLTETHEKNIINSGRFFQKNCASNFKSISLNSLKLHRIKSLKVLREIFLKKSQPIKEFLKKSWRKLLDFFLEESLKIFLKQSLKYFRRHPGRSL